MAVQASTLENGIRIVTEWSPSTRSVSMGVLVGASSRNDPEGQSGLAHLTEHALFLGTTQRDAAEIHRIMDQAGGQMGAFTTRDYTVFHASVLDDYLPYALELIGDQLLNSTVPESAFLREKQIVLREIEASADTPRERVNQQLMSQMWQCHPLGRPIAGHPDEVRNLTAEDVTRFHETCYRPDQMIIAAAGSIEHDSFVEQVRDAFWRMLGTTQSDPSPAIATGGVIRSVAETQQSGFAIGIPTFEYQHKNRYKLHILNAVLGGGLSSRLFCQLREARGLAYEIHSEPRSWIDGGLLSIEGSTQPEDLVDAVTLCLVDVFRLASGERPVTEEELWTARMRTIGQLRLAGESADVRMSRLLTQTFYFGAPVREEEIVRSIEAVTVSDLQSWAEQWLLPCLNQIVVSILEPRSSPPGSEDAITALLTDFASLATTADSTIPITS